jgi:hypothetical protein
MKNVSKTKRFSFSHDSPALFLKFDELIKILIEVTKNTGNARDIKISQQN